MRNKTQRFTRDDLPKGEFTAMEVANKFYPESVSTDSEGRDYNRAVQTVYRLLRKKDMFILELGDGRFYR
jgi:hypothetical protein